MNQIQSGELTSNYNESHLFRAKNIIFIPILLQQDPKTCKGQIHCFSRNERSQSLSRDMKLTKEHINKIRITFMSSEKQKSWIEKTIKNSFFSIFNIYIL